MLCTNFTLLLCTYIYIKNSIPCSQHIYVLICILLVWAFVYHVCCQCRSIKLYCLKLCDTLPALSKNIETYISRHVYMGYKLSALICPRYWIILHWVKRKTLCTCLELDLGVVWDFLHSSSSSSDDEILLRLPIHFLLFTVSFSVSFSISKLPLSPNTCGWKNNATALRRLCT